MRLRRSRSTKSACVRLDAVTPRHAAVLEQVWFNKGLSRSDIHARTGMRLRTVGSLVEELLSWGLLEAGLPRSMGVGRPQVPLAVAARFRNIVGLSLTPRRVILGKVGLTGEALQAPVTLEVDEVDDLVPTAARLLRKHGDAETLAIGVGLSGFIDGAAGEWLLSSAHPTKDRVSLEPLKKAADRIPICISNELHAMSAAARLAGRLPTGDSLLIHLDDGRIAASILIDGKPNRGSVLAANELGHTTMPVDVPRCYCGQVGCIERIFSSEYLRARGCKEKFAEVLSRRLHSTPVACGMVDLLCRTIANAVNFVRPNTLILSSPFDQCTDLSTALGAGLERYTLGVLFERLRVEWHNTEPGAIAQSAASLPMAKVFEEVQDRGPSKGWGGRENES